MASGAQPIGNVQAFFENYYTPKSAANVSTKMQKPWEVKLHRDTLKAVSVYRGAVRAENLLSKEMMPTALDSSLACLINSSYDRVLMSRGFQKWKQRALQLRSSVSRKAQRTFLAIVQKIQRCRVARRFF